MLDSASCFKDLAAAKRRCPTMDRHRRRHVRSICGVSLIAMLASACTTQISTRADLTQTTRDMAMAGVAYNLPMLQYKFEITRTLAGCPKHAKFPAVEKDAGRQTLLFIDPGISFDISVVATPRYVRGESYVVDYRSLSNAMKQTSFSFTPYAKSGNLKAINMAVDDKSGDIIKDVVKIGIGVASIVGGAPIIPGDSDNAGTSPAKDIKSSFTNKSNPRGDSGGGGSNVSSNDSDDRALFEIARKSSYESFYIECSDYSRKLIENRVITSNDQKKKENALIVETRKVETASTMLAIKGLSEAKRGGYADELESSLATQFTATTEFEKSVEEKGKAEKALVETSTRVWPERLPQDKGQFFATEGEIKPFFTNLYIARGLVLDRPSFSTALAALRISDRDQFDRLAERYDFLSSYIYPNGKAIPAGAAGADAAGANQANPDYCAPGAAVDVKACLQSIFEMRAWLVTVEMDNQQYPGNNCPEKPVAAVRPIKTAGETADGEPDKPIDLKFPTLACKDDEQITNATRAAAPTKREGTKGIYQAAPVPPRVVVEAREKGVTRGGLFVRQPAESRLFVCRGTACDINRSRNLILADPKADPTYAPQLGQLRYLPFRNTGFQSNELVLELAEDGTITKFEYKDKAAIAASMSAVTADVVKQIKDDMDAKAEKAKAEADGADEKSLKQLQTQIAILEDRAKLLQLQTPSSAEDVLAKSLLAQIDAETTLLNAKYARQKARNDLIAAGGKE